MGVFGKSEVEKTDRKIILKTEKKVTYNLIIDLEDKGSFTTFYEAYAEMYKLTKQRVKKGYTHQVLETANWIDIVVDVQEIPIVRFMFYDAKDSAHFLGLMKGTELVPFDKIPSNSEKRMRDFIEFFLIVESESLEYLRENLGEEMMDKVEKSLRSKLNHSFLATQRGNLIYEFLKNGIEGSDLLL